MSCKVLAPLALLCAFAPSLLAAPTLAVLPQGLQGGNWVWDVQITPDLAIAGGGSTALAIEMGFRLTTDPLVSVTNVNALVFDFNLTALPIFGWEVLYGSPPRPEGIEVNCASCTLSNLAPFGSHAETVVNVGATNEIFTAMGSAVISTPGPVNFLRIVATGPANGGPLTSTIQWLGSNNGQGVIAQSVGSGAQSFFFSGTASQTVPEPASAALCLLGAVGTWLTTTTRRRSK